MRRSPFVLTATAAGIAGVLSYHTHTQSFGSLPGGGRGTSGQTGSTTTGASAAPTGTTAGPTPALIRHSTGQLTQYGYGELAVKVTMLGGKITAVDVTGLRTAEQYSQSLAQQVVPMLRSEVLQSQSANINGVSGATYTSQAFATSLQGALKQLGA